MFDTPLNTSYQRRNQVNGAGLSELAGKLLQSHHSLDLDNNLTLHIVAIPRGNVRVAVNVWSNILLKRCALTNVDEYNHMSSFGYAIYFFSDCTCVHYRAVKNIMINEVSACFKTSGVQCGPVDCSQ